MADFLRVTCKANGPYLVSGPLEVEDPTGVVQVVQAGKMVALCRCGCSTKKPYCDGTHVRVGFQAEEAAASEAG